MFCGPSLENSACKILWQLIENWLWIGSGGPVTVVKAAYLEEGEKWEKIAGSNPALAFKFQRIKKILLTRKDSTLRGASVTEK